jgi:hypothetical protein
MNEAQTCYGVMRKGVMGTFTCDSCGFTTMGVGSLESHPEVSLPPWMMKTLREIQPDTEGVELQAVRMEMPGHQADCDCTDCVLMRAFSSEFRDV